MPVTKKVVKKTSKKISAMEVHSLLLIALQEQFSTDPTSPGLVTAYLKDGTFYASVCRYTERYGGNKQVVLVNKSNKSIDDAIIGLAAKYYNQHKARTTLEIIFSNKSRDNPYFDQD